MGIAVGISVSRTASSRRRTLVPAAHLERGHSVKTPTTLRNPGSPEIAPAAPGRRSGSDSGPAWARRAVGWAATAVVGASLLCSLALVGGLALADAPEVQSQAIVYGPVLGVSFNGPTGIAIDARLGEIVVANTGDHRVEIYSLNGRLRAHF